MKATENQLQGILNSPNRYIVPVFQRYYSWDKENWKQLWEDIESLIEESNTKHQTTHFMGSLVFMAEKSLPNLLPTFQIIDGQQRMMTIIILLCAIRNMANEYGFEELATQIQNTYIVHQYKRGLEKFRVYPRHQDKHDFEAAVLCDSEPLNRVGEALSFFERKISENTYLKDNSSLERFLQIVVSGLEFVHITIDEENPYQIFKSLNSTGVELDESDLIRNYVFMHLPIEEQDNFDEKYWKPLEMKFADENGKLNGALISSFFRDFLMMNGKNVRQSEIYKSFERRYQSGKFRPENIVKEFHKSADLYNIICGVGTHLNNRITMVLQKLRELKNSTAYPLILKLMLLELSDSDLEQAVELITSFILRRSVCHDTSRAYNYWFVAACNKVNKNPIENLNLFLLSKGFPGDKRFEEEFLSLNLYERRYAKDVLARIERFHEHKEPPDLSSSQVEHIMPQTLSTKWRQKLGPKAEEIHERLLHTIGNLTLSGYNPELSNKPFQDKKTEYKNSNIVITRSVSEYSNWNEDTIVERSKDLIDIAKKIWKAPESISNILSGSGQVELSSNGDKVTKLRMMLSRRTIPSGQKQLSQLLNEAGEEGISWSDMAKKMGRTKKQLAGVLGALGTRISNTDGLDDGRGIGHILTLWEVNGEWHYRMKPELIKALELEGFFE